MNTDFSAGRFSTEHALRTIVLAGICSVMSLCSCGVDRNNPHDPGSNAYEPLRPPASLSFTFETDSVKLKWMDNNSHELGYLVYAGRDSVTMVCIDSLDSNTTEFAYSLIGHDTLFFAVGPYGVEGAAEHCAPVMVCAERLPNSDMVQAIAAKTDNTMWRVCGYGYDQTFAQGQGVPKAISISSAHYWISDPTSQYTSAETWHIGGDANYNGHLWRLETRPGTTPGWVRRSIVINSTTILADDVGVYYDEYSGVAKVLAVGASSVNGSNVFSFNTATKAWSVFGGNAGRIDIDGSGNPWCVSSSGAVMMHQSGVWKRVDNGSFLAIDIGCGNAQNGVYVVTSTGSLLRYSGASWVTVSEFASTGKKAKRVDAALTTCAVSTTAGELYYIRPYNFAGWGIKKASISMVDDIALKIDLATL